MRQIFLIMMLTVNYLQAMDYRFDCKRFSEKFKDKNIRHMFKTICEEHKQIILEESNKLLRDVKRSQERIEAQCQRIELNLRYVKFRNGEL